MSVKAPKPKVAPPTPTGATPAPASQGVEEIKVGGQSTFARMRAGLGRLALRRPNKTGK